MLLRNGLLLRRGAARLSWVVTVSTTSASVSPRQHYALHAVGLCQSERASDVWAHCDPAGCMRTANIG